MRIGVIGLGAMGSAMAANLIEAGHDVAVWNRTAEKADPPVKKGATRAATPRAAADGRDAVMTMVFDDEALEGVVFGDDGILAAKGDAIHASMGTISLPLVEKLERAHRDAGRGFVSAPVFGRPEAAAARKLFVVAGGDRATIDRLAPLFEAVGQRTFVMGNAPVAAAVSKLAGNSLIGSTTRALTEIMALANAYGVDRATLLDMLTGTLFDAPIVRTYGGMLVENGGRTQPSPIFAKDSGLAVSAAKAVDVEMPLIATVHDRAKAAVEARRIPQRVEPSPASIPVSAAPP